MPSIPFSTESKLWVLDADVDEADLARADEADPIRVPSVDPDNPLDIQPGQQWFVRLDNGEDIPLEVAE